MDADEYSRRAVLNLGVAGLAALATRGAAEAATVATPTGAVAWDEAGRGPRTLIFVHGWTCDATSWAGQVPAFAPRYRVITLDLPGHGKSTPPQSTQSGGAPWSIALFADAVEAVREAAGVEKAVLIGHSMGAPVVRDYALRYPSRVEALVLVDGVAPTPTTPAASAPPMTGPEGMATRTRMVEGMFRAETPEPVRQRVRAMMLGAPEATAESAMRATRTLPWRADKIAVPVLSINADGSRLANRAALEAVYPNLTYQELPKSAHFLMMEQPQAFNRAVGDFLAKL